MKNLPYLFLALMLCSCDDGDIIVDNLAFDNIPVKACIPEASSGNRNYLFYKVDNASARSISVFLSTDRPILSVDNTYGPFNLSSSNSVEYRKYDAAPAADYFCSLLPPTMPNVVELYTSRSGEVFLDVQNQLLISTTAQNNEEAGNVDSDNDGIPNYLEPSGQDTDGDGLPDKIDADDDGDNVPTSEEGVVFENGQISSLSRDTDEDGIPDYLDPDDDGDGIPTILEDLNRDLDPTNDRSNGTDPDYLNPAIRSQADPVIEEFIAHTYVRIPVINITLPRLILTKEDETIVFDNTEDVENFGTYVGSAFQVTVVPAYVAGE